MWQLLISVARQTFWHRGLAEVTERDLGKVAEAGFEADLACARLTDLPPPPFNPRRAFEDEAGQQAMTRLVKAGIFADRSEELPMGLRQDLRSLVADVERGSRSG